jgi:hypothetical protein
MPFEQQSAKPKRKLRWYQYSMRTLLICVTLFAIFCGWYAVQEQKADRQKAAVKTLENHGYHITYDYEHYSTVVGYDKPTPAPNWIVELVGKDFLYDVYGVGEPISLPLMKFHVPALTDADMAVFEQLPRLRTLKLCNKFGNPAKITDQGLASLKNLKCLESLDICDTQVTDAGIKSLKNSLSSLEVSRGYATGNPCEWSEEESLHITTTITVP